MPETKKSSRVLDLLSVMKTIRYPRNDQLREEAEIKDLPKVHRDPKVRVLGGTFLKPVKPTLPKTKSDLCCSVEEKEKEELFKSNSLQHQRLQNMISLSNSLVHVSHQDEDDRRNEEPLELGDEPDTPCSVTPFFPSSIKGDPRLNKGKNKTVSNLVYF